MSVRNLMTTSNAVGLSMDFCEFVATPATSNAWPGRPRVFLQEAWILPQLRCPPQPSCYSSATGTEDSDPWGDHWREHC